MAFLGPLEIKTAEKMKRYYKVLSSLSFNVSTPEPSLSSNRRPRISRSQVRNSSSKASILLILIFLIYLLHRFLLHHYNFSPPPASAFSLFLNFRSSLPTPSQPHFAGSSSSSSCSSSSRLSSTAYKTQSPRRRRYSFFTGVTKVSSAHFPAFFLFLTDGQPTVPTSVIFGLPLFFSFRCWKWSKE